MFLFPLGVGIYPAYRLAVVPLLALAVMSESDQELIRGIYYQYRGLVYHVARKYFSDKPEELKDAVSTAVERMCRYVSKLREVPSNKMKVYVVLIVENVCRTRIRQIMKEREVPMVLYDDAILADTEGNYSNPLETIFEYGDMKEWLASFEQLSSRDRDIIWMRHVDQMEYEEIAAELYIKEGAVRTALARAKKRLRTAIREGVARNEN